MDIKNIKNPKFIKNLDNDSLNILANDIRLFLIRSIAKTGGHLSSNLGVVELTIALHYVFSASKDKFLFDVGHQSYVHKILTGRASKFDTLRKYQGISGFQKRSESKYDVFEAGHSSTSISGAAGMAIARDLDNKNYHVISIIGDASIASGEALEAINFLGTTNHKVIIILNDNQMSISKSVGGFNDFLNKVRLSKTYVKIRNDYKNTLNKSKSGANFFNFTKSIKDRLKRTVLNETIFEEFGLDYIGPIDGHNFDDLINAFNIAKNNKNSIVVHVVTKKGKGYKYAEEDNFGSWHSTNPFNLVDGSRESAISNKHSWSLIIANHILKWMDSDKDIVTITPAMIGGSCLNKIFNKYPNRSFDVGIAEQHGATLVAGLSLAEKKPVYSVYSSFSQRCYDQINHDIARMDLPCLIVLDRAGLVGSDGPTHHGVFDISIYRSLPNIIYFVPSNSTEAKVYINTVMNNFNHPYLIRISKNSLIETDCDLKATLKIGSWVSYYDEEYDYSIIAYGDNIEIIKKEIGRFPGKVNLINARFIKPFDEMILDKLIVNKKPILIYETDLEINGLGQAITSYLKQKNASNITKIMAIGDHYSCQGSIDEILKEENLDINSLIITCEEFVSEKGEN